MFISGEGVCTDVSFLRATGDQDHSCCPGEVRDLRELRSRHGREAAEQVPDLVRDPKVHAEGRLRGRGNPHPCFIACDIQLQNIYLPIKRTQIKKCFGYKEETFSTLSRGVLSAPAWLRSLYPGVKTWVPVPHQFPLIFFSAYLPFTLVREREELLLVCVAVRGAFCCVREASIAAVRGGTADISNSCLRSHVQKQSRGIGGGKVSCCPAGCARL